MAERFFVIGVDIGGTNIRAGLVDNHGNVIFKEKTSSAGDPVENLLGLLEKFTDVHIKAIGIGVAGLVDRNTGMVIQSPNLPKIEHRDFAAEIQKRFKIPVVVDNDANMAALGEKWQGAGREFKHFIMLTLGTGVGGGVVYNDRVLEISAELGHITVEAEGLFCPCGNNGCLESYVSSRAITTFVVKALEEGRESMMKEAYEGNFYRLTSEDIYRYALEGDSLARDSIRRAGRYLGIGIAALVNVFSPDAVIIGGGMLGAWDILAKEARKEFEKRAFKGLVERTRLLPAELADNAGIIGAAYLAINRR